MLFLILSKRKKRKKKYSCFQYDRKQLYCPPPMAAKGGKRYSAFSAPAGTVTSSGSSPVSR